MRVVEDIELEKGMSVSKLIEQLFKSGGFSAKKVAEAAEILEEMVKDDSVVFLSFPACITATGTRGVIKELVKRRLVDVVVTTCGTLDHDVARVWKEYYHGSFNLDDTELHRKGINRIGNILAPNESYGLIIEEKIQEILERIYSKKKRISTYELCWEIGKRIGEEKNRESSILYWCYKNRIPIFIPGITDGAVGSQIWFFYQRNRDFYIDILKDEDKLADIVFDSNKTGALIIGGGISKHHVIWWNQFKGGLDYAIYITTAVEWDGSLSGARVKEAISWGKVKEKARRITVEGDATLILPLIVAAVLERL